MNNNQSSCFLCRPNKRLVYKETDSFYTMLGLGPIIEGYSILATISHIPSMLDITHSEIDSLDRISALVRELLAPHYGEVFITEHGRVSPCDWRDRDGDDAHCFHAHRLVFPVSIDMSEYLYRYGLKVSEYPNFMSCWEDFKWPGEYLYCEDPQGKCYIAPAPKQFVRQFFRLRIADEIGKPELADWREYHRIEIVEAAMQKILGS